MSALPEGEYDSLMQLATGAVVGGKIIVEDEPLREGAVVTILARERSKRFEVPAELEADLLESIVEASRGEVVSADDLLRRIRGKLGSGDHRGVLACEPRSGTASLTPNP